ncbi:MAG: methyltransferase domain-containing protein [Natronospirillum sp.]|uniref:methyltransferase domain-containing protein n=1 Tax=Natronospirillum sp. TaxID=2812955 RepID=UPI0025EB624E|nr:methyltransferase domain-containing protein [Natronospirillum sp.]MCH8550965.1 methyltransferase domain-containing protein [Natronospirillum sp.]
MSQLFGKAYWQRATPGNFGELLAQDPTLQALNEAELQEIEDHLPDLQGYQVLDLGAGSGRFTGRLAARADRVTALDLSEGALAENRSRHADLTNIDYQLGDAVQADLGRQRHDLVFSNWLLMYLEEEDNHRLLSNLYQSLKPGGWLFVRESCRTPDTGWRRLLAQGRFWRQPPVPRLALQHVPVPLWQRWRFLWPGRRRVLAHRPAEQYQNWFAASGFELIDSGHLSSYEAAYETLQQNFWLLRRPAANYGEAAADAENSVGDGIFASPRAWTFGGETWRSFDDHIRRSIPFYDQLHELICGLASDLARPGGWIYELGCSTGALAERLSQACPDSRICGVDAEPTMVAAAQRRRHDNLEYHCADIRNYPLQPATGQDASPNDLVILCYTLQFVPMTDRLPLLQRLCAGLRPGGGLILAEKVIRRDPDFETRCRRVHHAFKRSQGYTQAEIDAKDRSLDGVLVPLSEDDNEQLLRQAGFTSVQPVFENTSFKAWLALRP